MFLRKTIGFAADYPTQMEIGALCVSAFGVRSPDRTDHYSGYRDRQTRGLLVPCYTRPGVGHGHTARDFGQL